MGSKGKDERVATVIHVKLGERSYPIRIGVGLPAEIPEGWTGARALLVTDSHVDALCGNAWQDRLVAAGLRVTRAVVPAGEASKNLRQVEWLYGEAVRAGLDRRSVIIALGGGVVGDLAGFVAATYLRGVRFMQIPTTLLAMVDSAVGGKTGVNLEEGKNLVGAFYQPGLVLADLHTLLTLPGREFVSGLAEVVKYGVIWDAKLFADLEHGADALLARDMGMLERVVGRCCEIKAEVIAVDERDLGVRAILNFGHTLGHAIENVSGYGQWLHGEAVAAGMVFAALLSARSGRLAMADAGRITRLLARLGLPVSARAMQIEALWPRLRDVMATDKKSREGCLRFVLAATLGSVAYDCEVVEALLSATFAEWTEAVGPWIEGR